MLIIISAIALMLIMPHIGQKYKDRVETVKEYEQDTSALMRFAQWDAGINMVLYHPVIGVGAGNFKSSFASYRPAEMSYLDDWMNIHNIFLQIFSETGLLGGGLFISIILTLFIGLNKVKRKNRTLPPDKRLDLSIHSALGVSLIGFCGAGFFLPGVYYGYFYIIIALIIAGRQIYLEKMG